MTIHNFYMFDKNGTLVYYGEWDRTQYSGLSIEEEGKIMYGMLFSIKAMASKVTQVDSRGSFLCYRTPKYTIHSLETPSGMTLAMNTDNMAQGVKDLLILIFEDIYLKFALINPQSVGKRITNREFKNQLDALINKTFIHTEKIS